MSLEHDLGLLGFGEHGDRGGGCVDAAGGLGGRYALDAVDAGLVAEQGTPEELFGNPRLPRTREFLERELTR